MDNSLVCKAKSSRRGFTLIELIVVIAILAILAVILVPVLGGFTERAKVSADNATARSITTSVTALLADGTIKLTDNASDGTLVVKENAAGTGLTVTATNVSPTPFPTAELEKLTGTTVKEQTGTGGYLVTISATNNTVTTVPQ